MGRLSIGHSTDLREFSTTSPIWDSMGNWPGEMPGEREGGNLELVYRSKAENVRTVFRIGAPVYGHGKSGDRRYLKTFRQT